MAAFISILYSDISDNQKSIQDRQGVLFFVCIFFAFNGIFQMITTFPMERGIINRERASKSYRISAYYPAKVLSEWPIRIVPAILFSVVMYWPAHFQREAGRFFIFLATAMLEFTAMNATGLMISSLAPSPETALALGPLLTVLFMLFGGFYINLDSIPVWIQWFSYCSPVKWAFIGLSVNEFRGRTFQCTSSDTVCLRSGEEVLRRLSIQKWTVGEAMGYQACVIVGLHCLAFFILSKNKAKLQHIGSDSHHKKRGNNKEQQQQKQQQQQQQH
eukprot:TRINITY_DN553_c0_g1_i4.p1 TRINITY_DN553_c0_g1~~TRINITY_DN553_c0_g1_i4.p1  ORF type:complete len:313 (+),score=108.37 TRINITY_DN553_c0_g1_i4:119-940(+)